MTTKLPISVCLIVKNEEEQLQACFDSLKNFCEIIVQDTGSTDNTLKICKDNHVVLYEEPWQSFAINRNILFSKATQPWTLWLDADEIVRTDLIISITSFLSENNPSYSGAKINRMVYFEGQWVKHGHWFPNWNGRLFKSDLWVMENKQVHESITLTHGKWKKIDGILEHYSFKDWEDYETRSRKYALLWANQKLIENKKATLTKATTHAIWSFIQGYFLKAGYLDGLLGLKIALKVSKEVYYKYALLANK